jgi:hypothetical protein
VTWRLSILEAPKVGEMAEFRLTPRTSAMASELDPRSETEE